MFEAVITMTSFIGFVIITKGLRRFSKIRENEKNILNIELQERSKTNSEKVAYPSVVWI